MAFDPDKKTETWLFEKIGESQGKPVFRRLKFNFVSYDGVPEQYIEPVSEGFHVNSLDRNTRILKPNEDHGRIVRFEFIEGARYPNHAEGRVHQFD